MRHSLVAKLTLVVASITVIAFALLAYILFQSTSSQFVKETESFRPRSAPLPVQQATITATRTAYASKGIDGLLELAQDPPTFGLPETSAFLIVDEDNQVIASTEPIFLRAEVTKGDDEQLRINASEVVGGNQATVSLTAVDPIPLLDNAGEQFGSLVILPEPLSEKAGDAFASSVWSSVAIWLVVVVALAVAATIWSLRRFLRPIDQLTDAARVLGAGSRPAQLPISGNAEIDRLIEAFNAATDAIEKTEQMRKQLISDISHELRTPVTNLKGQIEAVDLELLPLDKDFVATIRTEVRQMEGLIQDFQQLMVTDAGQVRLAMEALPLAETVTAAISSSLESVGARLDCSIPAEIEAMADEQRLRQVLANLVANSIRHKPNDLVITVEAKEDPKFVRLSFSDNGPGIASEDQPHIFERFYRAEKSRSRSTGGVGLGLTIVKGLIEAMGGSIELDASYTKGARFEIALQRARQGNLKNP
ncbi:MAG: ATP-binding protein [Blastomonas sp.]